MKKQLMAIILLVFLGVSSNLIAQKKIITIDDAVNIALKSSSETRTAKLDIEKANAAVNYAYGFAFPDVNLSSSFAHFIEKPQVPFPDFEAMLNNATYGVLFNEGVLQYDQKKFQQMGYSLMSMSLANSFDMKVEATQILFNAAVLQGIGSAGIYKQSSEYQLTAKEAKVTRDVKKAFYGVLMAQESVSILEASLINFQRNFKSVEAYNREGFVSDYDKLTAQVQLENFKPQVELSKSIVEKAMNGLKILMGMDPTENIEIKGSLEYTKKANLERDKLITQAMKRNYDLNSLDYKKQIDDAFIKLDEGDYYPTLVAFANYSYAGQSDEFDFMTYNQSMVGLALTINIFNGMRTTNKVQQKKIERLKTDEVYSQVQDVIKMNIKNLILEIEQIEGSIKATESNIELAKKGYEISNIRYKEGNGTQVEVLNAELQLRTAKTNLLQYYFQYLNATEELDYIIGGNN